MPTSDESRKARAEAAARRRAYYTAESQDQIDENVEGADPEGQSPDESGGADGDEGQDFSGGYDFGSDD